MTTINKTFTNGLRLKQLLAITAILLVAVMSACRKKEVITKYDNPQWTFTQPDSLSYIGATAVIALPDNLQPYIGDNDQMAVFVGDVCRGVANLEDGLFNFSIPVANAEEESPAYFRYWSSRTGYMYQSSETVVIKSGAIIGATAQPHQLTLTVI